MKSETLKFITKSFVLLSLFAVGSSALAEKYVFVYNGNYLQNSSNTIANSTNFVPNTCIWTCYNGNNEATLGNTSYSLKNGNRYLNSGDDRGTTVTSSNTAVNRWRLDGTYLIHVNNETSYLYYRDNTWKTSRSAGNNSNYGTDRYTGKSGNPDYRATVYTVTTGYLTGGYTDITISGDEYITTTGTKTYIHTNTINQTACSTYTFNNTTYYSTDNGNTASTTNPGSAVTTGYTWSLSDNANGYATVNSSTGVITVTSIPSGTIEMTLTCTLTGTHGTKSATKTITLSNAAREEVGLVIYSGGANGSYLNGVATGNNYSGITTFNPSTCVWEEVDERVDGNNLHVIKNGTFYINLGNSNLIKNDDNATIDENIYTRGEESGTTGMKIQQGSNNQWLRYNSSWARTGTSTDNGTDVAFAVTKITYPETKTEPTISGDTEIDALGTNASFTKTNAYYRRNYLDYVFYNGAHHYCLTETSNATASAPAAESFTYTWSLVGIDAQYATIDASTGVITYHDYPDNDVVATVKLTAASTNRSYDVSQQVTFVARTTDPTAISGTPVTVYVGKEATVTYTLSATGTDPVYNYVEASSAAAGKFTVSSTNPHRSGSVKVKGVGVGTANLNLQAKKKPGTEDACNTTVLITVKDVVKTPVISFVPIDSDDGETATATITCSTSGASIYYTTDGSEPTTSSTLYSTTFTVEDQDVVKAIAVTPSTVTDYEYYDNSDVATAQYSKCTSADPEIVINGSNVTFTSPEEGVTFYYTTDGSAPTTSSTSWTSASSAITTVPNEAVIKVLARTGTCRPSAVVSRQYFAPSGIADGVVILNDYEDHTWTYYAGAEIGNYKTKTDYQGKLYSPNPRNIKITYLGNGQRKDNTTLNAVTGVKVGVDADANTFVYYKTIENNSGYKYTTIPNPFSVRPKNNSTYYGFSYWRVKSVSGGSITYGSNTIADNTTNSTTQIPADAEITFVPTRTYTTNCQSMEVVFEAVWEPAEVSTNGTFSQGYNSVERNFYVVSGGTNDMPSSSSPCTYSSFYPNGTTNGTTAATSDNRVTRRGGFTAKADSKIEYIYLNNNNSTINGAGHNLTIGRGVSNSNGTGLCATDIYGFQFISNSNDSRDAQNFVLRIESGNYTNCHLFSNNVSGSNNNYRPTFQGTNSVRATLGCDYDRARANDGGNDKLTITSNLWMGEGCWFSDPANLTNGYFKCWTKSGKLLIATLSDGSGGVQSIYIGTSGNQTTESGSNNRKSGYIPPRFLYVEGGILGGIAGGLDDVYYTDTSLMRVYVKMTGGFVRGCVYGAGSYARAAGKRNFVLLGGEIGGWVAAGCNGIGNNTSEGSSDGTTKGDTYLYIGGDIKIGYKGTTVNGVVGGNVYGSGKGTEKDKNENEITYPMGTVINSNLVIADAAEIEHNVYGGGKFGYTTEGANIYILGGMVEGKVFGGADMKQGTTPTIYMDGGLVKGGIYGGSNTKGTISNDVAIQINGGQVGTTSTPANVHGGGYGQPTRVTGNVDVTLGTRNTSTGETAGSAVIYGDVYGGSALGYVNGESTSTTKHTKVTLNGGDVYGAVYGGGLGDGSNAANVYAPVKVTINGGSATNVFGCNNTNGAPQSTVNVDMTGGLVRECVYGGGNAAGYTGTPHVAISGGEVDKHVFGGGLGANAVITGNTDVKVTEAEGATTLIKGNVYGGGNAAAVTGNTKVTIGE